MFKIGDFSKICRVPVSALRYYADIGLLEPAEIDEFTGYRYYSLDLLPRLNRILALKDLGLSLTQIKVLLDEKVSPEEIRGMLRLKQAEIQQLVDEEQARLARVAARLKQIEEEGKMPQVDVVLKEVEAQHVLSIRERLPDLSHIGKVFGECYAALMQAGADLAAPPMALYHDQEFEPQNFDFEAAFPVSKSGPQELQLSGGRKMTVRELPAIASAASIVYQGEYNTFESVYTALGQWIQDNHYKIVGPPREIYLSKPEQGLPITEILFPVEKAL